MPFGFHAVCFCHYLHTHRHSPDLSALGFNSSSLGSIFHHFLEAIGPSMDIIYVLDQMDYSSESTESVTTLDENLICADSPDSAHPSSLVRSGQFADVPMLLRMSFLPC